MFLTFFLVVGFFFERPGYFGMPTSAYSLGCGGTGTALTDDPVFYNPAMLPFSNYSSVLVSYYGVRDRDSACPGFGEYSAYDGKYVNSVLISSPQTAFYWRILEAERVDTAFSGRKTDALLRADEAGLSFAIRDADLSSFSVGGTIKYFHASYREISYPDSGHFAEDSLVFRSFPAHGFFVDAGLAVVVSYFAMGVSAKNFAGKVFDDEISVPASYRAGISMSMKYASAAYDFEYSEKDWSVIHHYCIQAFYGPAKASAGYVEKDGAKLVSFGTSFARDRYIVSAACWGQTDDFKADRLDYYFSIGARF